MSALDEGAAPADVVERVRTPRGELVLRRRGDVFELVSNGVFLMDTSDGRSERLLADVVCGASTKSVLIAGLGVGYTLAAVLEHAQVTDVTVVEIEDAVVRWNKGPLAAVNAHALDDPRARLVVADFREWIERSTRHFDAICMDVDNGPDWTVTDDNRSLYTIDGLRSLQERLTPQGRLAVWSSAPARRFEERIKELFDVVERHESPAANGPPDIIWVAAASRERRQVSQL